MSFLSQVERGMSSRDLESKGRAGKQDRVEMSLGQKWDKHCLVRDSGNTMQKSMENCKISVLPLHWRMRHSSRWIVHILASELSLIAFILLLVMIFSKKWLYLSGSRFYQRWPMNVSARIYTSAHIMSRGLLQTCKAKICHTSENEKDNFKLWTNHPVFGLATITFSLTIGLGIILTIWMHLLYLPVCQKLPFFGWIGIVLSFSEVTFMFSTLMLFPINLWIFELKKNLSIPIGWSYFIGWLVFILYTICGILCYFNYKDFLSMNQIHPSDNEFFSNNYSSEKNTEQITSNISHASVRPKKVLGLGQRKTSLDSKLGKAVTKLHSELRKKFSVPLDSELKNKILDPLGSESKNTFSKSLDSESKNILSRTLDHESKNTFSEALDSESKDKSSELLVPSSDHSPESLSSPIPTVLE